MPDTNTTMKLVSVNDLRQCLVACASNVGLPAEQADALVDVILDCELHGRDDHGVFIFGSMITGASRRPRPPDPTIRVLSEAESVRLTEADSLNVLASVDAMRWCIGRARDRKGIAVAGVRGSNFVAAAPYVRMAAEAGCIGFACRNADSLVAPPDGVTRTVGTNPLGFGIPTGRHPPFVLDFATTNVAGAKLLMAAAEGLLAPQGSIRDRNGRPTLDPQDYVKGGGAMSPLGYPFAGHKGFGLALVVDALAGILTGSGFAKNVAMGSNPPGNFFWALDVEAFLPLAEFRTRMDQLLDMVKAGEPMEGIDELYFAGERGHRRAADLTASGVVPLAPVSWKGLVQACQAVDVALPAVIASERTDMSSP